MNGETDKADLERQIAELRAVLDNMAEDTQVKSTKHAAEIADIRAAVVSVQETLDEVRRALLGNSAGGVTGVVDKLLDTVTGLGRIFETMHHESHLKDEALAELTEKWQGDMPWKAVTQFLLTVLMTRDQNIKQVA